MRGDNQLREQRMNVEPNTAPKIERTRLLARKLGLVLLFSAVVFVIAAQFDLLEKLAAISRNHEKWELEEVLIVALFLAIAWAAFSMRRWIQYKCANTILLSCNEDLQMALIQIKELKGSIPICSACKKIRDGDGFWHRVESYIERHTRAEFTHGICPECTKTLYPEYAADKKNRDPDNQ